MSGIDNAKQAMGWQHPTLRDRCANCHHGERVQPSAGLQKPGVRCAKGSFFTHPNAVCKQHVQEGA